MTKKVQKIKAKTKQATAKTKPAGKAPAKTAPKKTAAKVVKTKTPIKKPAAKKTNTAAKKAAPKKAVKPVTKAAPVKKAAVKTPIKTPVKTPSKAAAPTTRPQMVTMARPAAQHPPVAARPIAAPTMRPVAPAMRPGMPRPGVAIPARPANDTPVDFRTGDYVVYPAHGVGTIEGVETQSIAGMSVTLYAISFEKDRMRLKIPVQKAQIAGLRKLSSGDRLKDALKTLTGKARIKRTMWSRRAQEYEAKINSGDPVQIAEVLRDLRRPKDDTEQSYSERQIYQSALERLAREVAAVQRIAEAKAVEHLETVLTQAA